MSTNSSSPQDCDDRCWTCSEDTVAAALSVIAAARSGDFDGHTEFDHLSPAERLAWMESALLLIESRREAIRSGR